jgi:transposase
MLRALEEWLTKLPQAGVRRRAELLYQQLDGLRALRREVRPEFLAESRKHKAAKLLRQIPCIGPIRAARLIALMQTPHRFRSKRRLRSKPLGRVHLDCQALAGEGTGHVSKWMNRR